MPEQELKLHVPAASAEGVLRELRKRAVSRLHLHALYFDTPERELARARIALRLRREGDHWVQTLKMPGADAITRLELNHPRPGPVLDLSVYAGTEVEAPLMAIQGELGLRYETDIVRQLCQLRTRQGTLELAYDTGALRAGGLALPVSEVEFELLSGRPAAIFTAARAWQQRHGLVLDARSKSERGDALATLAARLAELGPDAQPEAQRRVAGFWAPRPAQSVTLREDMDAGQAMAAIAAECVDQIVRNAVPLAEVDTAGVYPAGNSEHVHQLRVGMRRLRSAWRLFDGWIEPPPAELLQGLRGHFGTLGANRDQDVLAETVAPALERAGMPSIPVQPSRPDEDARSVVAGRAFQGWLLDLLAWSLNVKAAPLDRAAASDAAKTVSAASVAGAQPENEAVVATIIPLHAPEPQPAPVLSKLLRRRLHGWHKRVVAEGQHFATLPVEARHELRKRAKRLRYGLSFAESLLSAERLRSYRKTLARVQDLLGEFNDLAVARGHYENCLAEHPQAWFALGWINARMDALSHQAEEAFVELARARAFWKS
ncbi:CYTH and CHAD domain-containing protein [Bordetella sp. 2513F-2]